MIKKYLAFAMFMSALGTRARVVRGMGKKHVHKIYVGYKGMNLTKAERKGKTPVEMEDLRQAKYKEWLKEREDGR